MKTQIHITYSPVSGLGGKEALDLGLVCAAFEQQVRLVFIDKGIHYLRKDIQPEKLSLKNLTAQIKGLEFYDIEQVIAEQESLIHFAVQPQQLHDNVQILSRHAIKQLSSDADNLVIL